MTTTVFLAVIGAALMHAIWNALIKGGKDKMLNMTAVIFGHAPLLLLLLPFTSLPAPASWPYLAGSVALHLGYQWFLINSYQWGDLSQVYPIARGSAPLIVATVSVLFLGVVLAPIEGIAIALIGCGIISLCLVRHADGLRNGRAALLALITGCFISAYSLTDGNGVRVAGNVMDYYAWHTIGNILVFGIFAHIQRPTIVRDIAQRGKIAFFIGGSASFTAYCTVMWAFSQAPIALVVALRETSIIFALLIGVVMMGEKLNLVKLASTMMTVCGAVLLRFSRS
ncbi:EamA family transporter [Thalassospira sp. MCCC 1A01428]|uniref:EamA family transporter n=1 Tax=Thalassospira sp. MCCC 1A01428 TaxID=1470575 RepID=UPI000A1EB577|nr:EamA family transporter [Thalassospira sp. MCCC 1A01428]OSQ41710.1 membrane protein [Thalassospira sp. MCCC 1A01428]